MNATIEIKDKINFSKAVRNPFAKIAKAARENNGELSPDVSKQMMREAIAELRNSVAGQDES